MDKRAAAWGLGALGTTVLLAWVSRKTVSKRVDAAQDWLLTSPDFEPVRALPERAAGLLRDWKARVVANTTGHETHKGEEYETQNKNADACGLSFGLIQWSQCTGNLGVLLTAMQASDPQEFARIFGPSWRSLLAMTTAGRGSNLGPVEGAVLWREPWTSRFEQAGRYEPFQRVQRDLTKDDEHMRQAKQIASLLGADTERALALFYDRSVQQTDTALSHAKALSKRWRDTGAPPTVAGKLEVYGRACVEMWRSFTPRSGNYSEDGRLYWKQVPGKREWRVWAGEKFDLYKGVKRRVAQVLENAKLRDQRVDLTV